MNNLEQAIAKLNETQEFICFMCGLDSEYKQDFIENKNKSLNCYNCESYLQ
jgi:hypothetical protein